MAVNMFVSGVVGYGALGFEQFGRPEGELLLVWVS